MTLLDAHLEEDIAARSKRSLPTPSVRLYRRIPGDALIIRDASFLLHLCLRNAADRIPGTG